MSPYLGLERSAGKLARCVLMGVKIGNSLDLPGLIQQKGYGFIKSLDINIRNLKILMY